MEWSKTYGGIFSLKAATTNIIVLSDRRLVKELVDKKGHIYSNRPHSIVGDLVTGGDSILLENYTPYWRLCRKLFHQTFMTAECDRVHTRVIEAEGAQMIRDFLLFPDENMMHPRRFSYSVSNSIS